MTQSILVIAAHHDDEVLGCGGTLAKLASEGAALHVYNAELSPWPHPRSHQGVEPLACWRGATVGVEAAEVFILGRQLA